MPLSRLAVAVLLKGQGKPHAPDPPRGLFAVQSFIRQGGAGARMPACQRSTRLFPAALAQNHGENTVFTRPQQQAPACRCIKGGRIAPDLDNHRGQFTASGRLTGAPDRILQPRWPDKNKAPCINAVLPQAVGKRQAAVDSRSRIDDPEDPPGYRATCLSGPRQQGQGKSRRCPDVTAMGAAHFVQAVPGKAARKTVIDGRHAKRQPGFLLRGIGIRQVPVLPGHLLEHG